MSDLADEARRTGQNVELDESGTPHGTDELRLAVYRIVQEGLTNARKHATGASVQVTVRWLVDCAHVRVLTSPACRAADSVASIPGSGRGLAGLHERVERLGGNLRAGPTPTGVFEVEAELPVGSD